MPQPNDPRHNLRLPAELKKKLGHSAVDNGRSVNAEILARLEASFEPEPIRAIENLLKSLVDLSDNDRAEAFSLLARASDILGRR